MSELGEVSGVKVESLDHMVLTVTSIERTCSFYHDVLGMEVIAFGEGRVALRFGNQKINLHEAGREFEPKARRPTVGAGDLCFITHLPLAEFQAHLENQGIALELGPTPRTGARGPMDSIYLRDPDGNLIEVSNYL